MYDVEPLYFNDQPPDVDGQERRLPAEHRLWRGDSGATRERRRSAPGRRRRRSPGPVAPLLRDGFSPRPGSADRIRACPPRPGL